MTNPLLSGNDQPGLRAVMEHHKINRSGSRRSRRGAATLRAFLEPVLGTPDRAIEGGKPFFLDERAADLGHV
ncbi:hypothetical protein GCM10023195_76400 [Actinoallomurus liliacearum]|uniref:Uncharacterized protein n=2 Tax=Actinoallomurus liliacearum TaxID=1080073 RepID=A0ABP8TY87_9ACTN